MMKPDLFRYPDAPGFKAAGTSEDAADSAKLVAAYIRAKVLRAVQQRPMTPDECAETLGLSILSVRPRFSELRADCKIVDTGARRENISGRKAAVWRAAKAHETSAPNPAQI
jgi:predicted ArsR family transcriptional regulator